MSKSYSNLPLSISNASSTVKAFENYQQMPVEIDSTTLAAIKGYFTNNGFDATAAESIAIIIIKQSKQDGYNPMQILDTLKGVSSVELSGIVAELLNYNRFKSSSLGYAQPFQTNPEIERNIIDGPALIRTYAITASDNSINENNSVVFTVDTTNVPNGTKLYWTIDGSGITASDFLQGISGEIIINNNKALITINALLDSIIENTENAVFKLRKKSIYGSTLASIAFTIGEPSISIVSISDYIVIEYTFLTGSDLDTRTRMVSPAIGNYIGWGLPNVDTSILEWGTDNTGIGTESVLFKVANFKTAYPSIDNVTLDCRAFWYGTVGTEPVGLKISLYKGGSMVKTGFTWNNPTAVSTNILDISLKTITLQTASILTNGERIATFNYNLTTGIALLDPADTTVYN